MVTAHQTRAFRRDQDQYGRQLTVSDREKLLKQYLPSPDEWRPQYPTSARFQHKPRVRPAIKNLLHLAVFTCIHVLFSIYVTVRSFYNAIIDRITAILYYNRRTPALIQRDLIGLSKVPAHLSVILELPNEGEKKDRLDTLVSNACELVAWSASAGIPMLSIYERTGILKSTIPYVHRRMSRTLDAYFGESSPTKPVLALRAPHRPAYSPPHSPEVISHADQEQEHSFPQINVLLIDETDGRQTLVDLTKTLAEMSQRGRLAPSDISTELIDVEISESVMGEPDLMIVFGDRMILEGYPPWQIRLTEIFHVQDNSLGVSYVVFLRALYNYAKAQFRIGR